MPSTTSRLGLTQPLGGDAPSVLRTSITGNAAILDAAVLFSGGATNIATSQSTSSASYTTLATPDQVTGIVLPANGILRVGYWAQWQESVSQAARAAIFIGANQLKAASGIAVSGVGAQAALTGPSNPINVSQTLSTCPFGLVADNQGITGFVTTGQVLGFVPKTVPSIEVGGLTTTLGTLSTLPTIAGPVDVFAAAGTYTVSVQFKASSGSVTVANRMLWVQSIAFS